MKNLMCIYLSGRLSVFGTLRSLPVVFFFFPSSPRNKGTGLCCELCRQTIGFYRNLNLFWFSELIGWTTVEGWSESPGRKTLITWPVQMYLSSFVYFSCCISYTSSDGNILSRGLNYHGAASCPLIELQEDLNISGMLSDAVKGLFAHTHTHTHTRTHTHTHGHTHTHTHTHTHGHVMDTPTIVPLQAVPPTSAWTANLLSESNAHRTAVTCSGMLCYCAYVHVIRECAWSIRPLLAPDQ